ncbi:2-hydroxychromene-2-carboxylate isomerase [Roseivivax sp. THAF40]|uniref:2-hydroxychromene-2-carboxylate isomerase n=1 Tax=unclassified Roseivivax TaxID=2639302 RepID=UPI0012682C78|nr:MULTISPECIES: 2-hydroxychromene-2-carboxylate isomerase [unclassified Roseivivax]QFS84288.1 2-hydroxychromene-2-carboxylate isomerase [Roseivivax sp. THAF197b]QFT48116.1 2-hydroxychromene-2-carboxylate isomerase [Roseivivax sp. THAF40]
MPQIDYYFFTISPWAYLGGDRLEEIAKAHGAEIAYKPVNPGAVFKAHGGLPLDQRPQARQDYRLQELDRTQKKTGLPLTIHPAHFPTNPAPSSYAIIAADKAGGGDLGLLVRKILSACWAEERDIAQDDVIADCLEAAGFDRGLVTSGMLSGAETFERYTEEAVQRGVFGSPYYVVDSGQHFWGQDRLDDLEMHLAGKI